jgi:hypothetical protein
MFNGSRPDKVYKTAGREFLDQLGGFARSLVVFAEGVRQARVRIGADVDIADA